MSLGERKGGERKRSQKMGGIKTEIRKEEREEKKVQVVVVHKVTTWGIEGARSFQRIEGRVNKKRYFSLCLLVVKKGCL